MEQDWNWSGRGNKQVALILVDVDHFKAYNDHYGHQQGDNCLIRLTHIIQETCNTDASLSRYGGEEFAVLIPNVAYNEAHRLGPQIVDAFLSAQLRHEKSPTAEWVSVSAGLAALRPTETLDPGVLIGHADHALYAAKAKVETNLSAIEPMAFLSPTVNKRFSWLTTVSNLKPDSS